MDQIKSFFASLLSHKPRLIAISVIFAAAFLIMPQGVRAEVIEKRAECSNSNGDEGNPWSCNVFQDATFEGAGITKVELVYATFDDSGRVVITSPTGQVNSISTIEDKSCLQSIDAQDITSFFGESGTYTVSIQADNDCRDLVSGSAILRITYDRICQGADAPTCDTPGTCQTGPGKCEVIDGKETCVYPTSNGTCDLDGDQCTLDVCASKDGGVTASCIAGQNVCDGLVPCGRKVDNPNTTNNETDQCSLCHLAFLANNFVLFIFSIVSVMALLAFVIAGFLYVLTGANPAAKNQAKTAIENIVKGYIIIFCSWLIIDFVLSAWGFIDPLGGEWSVVCNLFGLNNIS